MNELNALRAEWFGAVHRERLVRDYALLPLTESIGPFEAVPLALPHYLALRLVASPYVVGGARGPEDAVVFLWQVSPLYSPKDARAKRRFLKACRSFVPHRFNRPAERQRRTERFIAIDEAIRQYVREALQDSPASNGQERPSYWSDGVAIVDLFATAYGWTAQDILGSGDRPGVPLKVLFQLEKIITAREKAAAGKAPILFNPSDAQRARWFSILTAQN